MSEREELLKRKVVRELFEEVAGYVKGKIDEINESADESRKLTCERGGANEPPTIRIEREVQYIRIVCDVENLNNILVEAEVKPVLEIQPSLDEENDEWRLRIKHPLQLEGCIGRDNLRAVVWGVLEPLLRLEGMSNEYLEEIIRLRERIS